MNFEINFPVLLTLLFIGLKLTGHLAWSWAWVLSPLWIGLAIALSFVAIIGIIFGVTVVTNALVEMFDD